MQFMIVNLLFLLGSLSCCSQEANKSRQVDSATLTSSRTPFSSQELAAFRELQPIDAHAHAYQNAPEFFALLKRLNLHVLDILVALTAKEADLNTERSMAWKFVNASDRYVSLCTTFNPYLYNEPSFAPRAIDEIDRDFDRGAIAVKIWKNVGKEVRGPDGTYLLPDNPAFSKIYREIAAKGKTLITHLADPDEMWEVPDPASPRYAGYLKDPSWYMSGKPGAPSKATILLALDRVLAENPDLRVVGAHLGSMEGNFRQLSDHLDRYPNFAVDVADRISYIRNLPRSEAIAFIEKYQDRLLYGTDNQFPEFPPAASPTLSANHWESMYAFDWRFLATGDLLEDQGRTYRGLALPESILQKLYHANAERWFSGIDGQAK